MIKRILMLSLFVTSWNISATKTAELIELSPRGVYSACKGRYCKMETSFNAISLTGQEFWVFQDPTMDCRTAQTFQSLSEICSDPLLDNSALNVHTCSVIREGGYFSNILIAKFDLNPENNLPQRALETFLLQLIHLKGSNKIYAWINQENNEENNLLNLLTNKYYFTRSKEVLFCPFTDKKIVLPNEYIIQLEVDRKAFIPDSLL